MSNRGHVIYLCHAVDELLKNERAITTDSAAAANKVFGVCLAMRKANLSCTMLSCGRGRQNGSGSWHSQQLKRYKGVASMYASFYQFPLLTHLVTMLSLVLLLFTLLKKHPGANVLVYNRSYHYLPAILLARLMNSSLFLDLEDGYINDSNGGLKSIKNSITRKLFDFLCPSGALLAASSLQIQVKSAHILVCYGVASTLHDPNQDWASPKLRILFGGTLLEEVGSQLFLDALVIASAKHLDLSQYLEVIVTGKGPWEDAFTEFTRKNPSLMTFAKDLSAIKYTEVLRSCHVGLSLRLSKFEMGATTFPSKVIEYASNGLLLLSTRVGDVPRLLGDEAVFLEHETSEALAEQLLRMIDLRQSLQITALKGRARVLEQCSHYVVGNALSNFFRKRY